MTIESRSHVHALVGVVEDCPAFKTAHLSCEPPASRPDIVNEPLVGTKNVRVGDSHILNGFLAYVGVHWRFRSKGQYPSII